MEGKQQTPTCLYLNSRNVELSSITVPRSWRTNTKQTCLGCTLYNANKNPKMAQKLSAAIHCEYLWYPEPPARAPLARSQEVLQIQKIVEQILSAYVLRPHREFFGCQALSATCTGTTKIHDSSGTSPACWIDSSAKTQASLPRESTDGGRLAVPFPTPRGAFAAVEQFARKARDDPAEAESTLASKSQV